MLEVSLHDRDGRAVGRGAVGEIWLRGPSVSSGYWRQEAATRAAFSDGWYRTGDAAYQDAEGFYFIVDRWKDMYISGGENVYPAEVEAVMATLPGIAEVAVVGQPDANWGEVGEAFVVANGTTPVVPADIIQLLRQQLAGYKVPKTITLIDALPRTGSGKVKKTALRRA
jgi:fatty-acyl-CoA synthase